MTNSDQVPLEHDHRWKFGVMMLLAYPALKEVANGSGKELDICKEVASLLEVNFPEAVAWVEAACAMDDEKGGNDDTD